MFNVVTYTYRTTCVSRQAPVKNWKALLEYSFTDHMHALLTATTVYAPSMAIN